jgi:hypothetical protein
MVTSSFTVVHTSSENSTKWEAVEPLAALTGVEVCETAFRNECAACFRTLFDKFPCKRMFATEQVTQNKARMKDEGGRMKEPLCFVLGALYFGL